jgi:hypothetical protein
MMIDRLSILHPERPIFTVDGKSHGLLPSPTASLSCNPLFSIGDVFTYRFFKQVNQTK